MNLLQQIGVSLPLVQAPMAGVSTPQLAAAVSDAGGLGSIAAGATNAAEAARMIAEVRARTGRPFSVNLFCHPSPRPDPVREAAWLEALAPLFARFDARPPAALRVIYKSFDDDDELLALLLERTPTVVSFHFGLPAAARVTALKAAGCILLATATSLAEAHAAKEAGIDGVVAQGFEAGGHRGLFDPSGADDCLGTLELARLLVAQGGLPVIAAGGIMNGQGIAAALDVGAVAAQMGTAFISCPETSADAAYRQALAGEAALHTVMTTAISGRPARCLANRFTEWGRANDRLERPDYPIAYDAGKALGAAAKAVGEHGYSAHWAGLGAPLARAMPAADLVRTLMAEVAGRRTNRDGLLS